MQFRHARNTRDAKYSLLIQAINRARDKSDDVEEDHIELQKQKCNCLKPTDSNKMNIDGESKRKGHAQRILNFINYNYI